MPGASYIAEFGGGEPHCRTEYTPLYSAGSAVLRYSPSDMPPLV